MRKAERLSSLLKVQVRAVFLLLATLLGGAANAGPMPAVVLGWEDAGGTGTISNKNLVIVAIDPKQVGDITTLDLLVRWDGSVLTTDSEPTSPVSTSEFSVAIDPADSFVTPPDEGYRILIVSNRGNGLGAGSIIARFVFQRPSESQQTVFLDPNPDARGAVFSGKADVTDLTVFQNTHVDPVIAETPSPTATATPTATETGTATPTVSPTDGGTSTPTPTPSATDDVTPSPSATADGTPTESPTPTDFPTLTPSPSPTEKGVTPTATPTETDSPTPSPTESPKPTPAFDIAFDWDTVSDSPTETTRRFSLSEINAKDVAPNTIVLDINWDSDNLNLLSSAVVLREPVAELTELFPGVYRFSFFAESKGVYLGPGTPLIEFTFEKPASEQLVSITVPPREGGVFRDGADLTEQCFFNSTLIGPIATTPTPTPEPTETASPSPSATEEPTPTEAPTPTEKLTPSPTETETPTPTESETPTPTETESPTPSPSQSATASPTESETPSPSPTESATPSPSQSASPTPSQSPTASQSASPTASNTPVPTASISPSPTASATPTESATPSPSISPSVSPSPTDRPVFQDFQTTAEGWQFYPFLDMTEDNGSFTPGVSPLGTLNIRSANNTNSFAFWDSPTYELTPAMRRGAGSPHYFVSTYRVTSDATNAGDVPTIRLRTTTVDASQSDVVVIDSNGDAANSPVAGQMIDFRMFWALAAGDPAFRAQFDLLNFAAAGAPNTEIRLDRIQIEPVDPAVFNTPRQERVYDFATGSEGWSFRSVAEEGFVSPTSSTPAGSLAITSVPFDGATTQFGWWNGPETGSTTIRIEERRLYYALFFVESSLASANDVPSFRMRFNESGFQAGQYTQASSNYIGSGPARNVPTAGNEKIYRVFFPPNTANGRTLFPSFDLLSTPQDFDSTNATVLLNRVEIYSIPVP